MNNILIAKINDIVKKSDFLEGSTKFLNLEEVSEVISHISKQKISNYMLVPENCERKIAYFYPDFITEHNFPIKVIKIEYKDKVSHRDILGSIMGLNIKREFIGDIIVFEDYAYVYVFDSMCEFILRNLTKVSRQSVSLTEIPIDQIEISENEFKLIKDTVKTLRFDSIVSSGFSISRTDANTLIKAGKVFLNSREIIKPDYKVLEGDKISIKGKGKMELFMIGGTSKKERIFIEIKKYI